MKTTKSLMLATVAALSLGVGAAMAQESAGGFIAGSSELQPTAPAPAPARTVQASRAPAASVSDVTPQYGSSDRASVSNWPALEGGDGGG